MINDVTKLQNNKGRKFDRSEFEFRMRYCPIKKIIFLWQYKRHLKKRIDKNNFGRREEW